MSRSGLIERQEQRSLGYFGKSNSGRGQFKE